jgi:phosphatidylinositol-4,5-bisphosphate 4-phosphatase
MHAWEALSGKTVEIPVLQKGKAHTIKVDFTAITFNFPVNELAQSIPLLSWLPFINGHKTSDSYNAKAFHALIGDMKKDAPISGFAEKLLGQLNERDQKIVTTLIHDIRDIWHKKQHHSAGKDAYKLAIRVALLVLLLKIGLTFNCKSGKDRTGWLDTFIKYLLDSYASDQDPTESLKKIDKEKFSKIALNSGNDQIQRLNTGAPGNKCMKEIPFCTLPWSYFLTKEAYRQVKGLSFLVGS